MLPNPWHGGYGARGRPPGRGGGLHGAHIFRENAAIMFVIDFEAHFVKFLGSKIDLGAHFGRLLGSETRFGGLVRPAVCA